MALTGQDTYVTRKISKTEYKLQKYCLVLSCIDEENSIWHILMLDSVREVLAREFKAFLEMAQKGIKAPSAKELRMRAALRRFVEGEKVTVMRS